MMIALLLRVFRLEEEISSRASDRLRLSLRMHGVAACTCVACAALLTGARVQAGQETDERSPMTRFRQDHSVESLVGYRRVGYRPSLLADPIGAERYRDRDVADLRLGIEYEASIGRRVSLALRYGAFATSESRQSFLAFLDQTGLSTIVEDNFDGFSDRLCFLQGAFDELNIGLTLGTFFAKAGILDLRFGNTLVFNPVDYLTKFARDPRTRIRFYGGELGSGTHAYAGASASLLIGEHTYSLYLVAPDETIEPLNHDANGGRNVTGLGAFRAAFLLGANTATVYLFAHPGRRDKWDRYRTGLGAEVEWTMGPVETNVQFLVSDGWSRYVPRSRNGGYALLLDSSFEGEHCVQGALSASAAVLSLNLFGAYYFNQTGYDVSTFDQYIEGLRAAADIEQSEDSEALRYATLANRQYNPMTIRRHYCSLTVSRMLLTGLLTLSGSAFLSLEDGSGMATAQAQYSVFERLLLSVRPEVYFGRARSAFGLGAMQGRLVTRLEAFL